MTEGTRALGASAAIHLAVVAGLAALVQMAAAPDAPMDAPIELPADLLGGGARGPGPTSGPPVAHAIVPSARTPVGPQPPMPVVGEAAPVLSSDPGAAPSAALAAAGPAGGEEVPSSAASGGSGTGSGAGAGAGAGTGPGSGLEVLRQVYRKEHFAYIQAQVARGLLYPPQAVKAGWTGRVLVTFLVQEDGTIADLAVAGGSGVPVLDRAALAAIRRAAPFPRPPVPARLVLPIEFDLE